MNKKYWLKGMLIGALVGVILYAVTVVGMYIFEVWYLSKGNMDVFALGTLLALLWGWIWIIVGLFFGTIIGIFHKHLKIVVPIVVFVLLVPICYFVYDNYIRERNNGVQEGDQVENFGKKFIYKNGQWQPY